MLNRSHILAHRGVWYDQHEKNTPLALKRALEAAHLASTTAGRSSSRQKARLSGRYGKMVAFVPIKVCNPHGAVSAVIHSAGRRRTHTGLGSHCALFRSSAQAGGHRERDAAQS